MRISVAGTPVPKRDIELKSSGSGPVKSYKLSPEEMERELARFKPKSEEESKMPKLKKKEPPSKIEFLRIVASGKNMNQAAKELGLSSGNLYYWLNKWDLKSIKPERAKVLLDELKNNDKIILREKNIPNRESVETETTKKRLAEAENEIESLRNELDIAMKRIYELENENEEIKQDLVASIATIDKAITDHGVVHDTVNHPEHYTFGKVECIDAIESATTGLGGGQAYATGAAIKYLWRWSRKNGIEDLQKAKWYIDRIITLEEQESN